MARTHSLSITNTTNGTLPSVPFARMKEAVLGKDYKLSLVFIGETRAQSLNKAYRKKHYVPNVLSFPLSKSEGEIFICPSVAKKEAGKAGVSERKHVAHLFIHALLHLKGARHGDTMERKEKALLRSFGVAH